MACPYCTSFFFMEGEVTAGRVHDFFERGCQQGIGSQWQLAWLLQRAGSFTALAEIRLFLIFFGIGTRYRYPA